jgi:hypothetical protein
MDDDLYLSRFLEKVGINADTFFSLLKLAPEGCGAVVSNDAPGDLFYLPNFYAKEY